MSLILNSTKIASHVSSIVFNKIETKVSAKNEINLHLNNLRLSKIKLIDYLKNGDAVIERDLGGGASGSCIMDKSRNAIGVYSKGAQGSNEYGIFVPIDKNVLTWINDCMQSKLIV